MRELEEAEVDFGEDGEDVVAYVRNNADLYAANQESTELINEAHMEHGDGDEGQGSVTLYGSTWVKMYCIISRLVSTKRRRGSLAVIDYISLG